MPKRRRASGRSKLFKPEPEERKPRPSRRAAAPRSVKEVASGGCSGSESEAEPPKKKRAARGSGAKQKGKKAKEDDEDFVIPPELRTGLRERRAGPSFKEWSSGSEESESDSEGFDDSSSESGVKDEKAASKSKKNAPPPREVSCAQCNQPCGPITDPDIHWCPSCHSANHIDCLPEGLKPKELARWKCEDCCDGRVAVETILKSQDGGEGIGELYFIKWQGVAYRHCSWATKSRLDCIARQKLRNFLVNGAPTPSGSVDEGSDDEDSDSKRAANTHEARLEEMITAHSTVDRIVAERNSKRGRQYFVKWCEMGHEACTWEDVDSLEDASDQIAKFKQVQKFANKPRTIKKRATKVKAHNLSVQPSFLYGGSLFNYQVEGVSWLRHCFLNGIGAILADEMGLGKTVQAAAFVASLFHDQVVDRPFLIVVPLSTIANWQREFEAWCPSLRTVTYVGGKDSRKIMREHEFYYTRDVGGGIRFDVMFTSYEIPMNDSALASIKWSGLIIDEGHRLKNNEARLFKILENYKTLHRVLLTGTPLQNNILELDSLMSFIEAEQREGHQVDETLAEERQVADLHKWLRPHMLRRVKADVKSDIPPKTEHLVRANLNVMQRQFYRDILAKNFKALNKNVASGQVKTSLLNVVMQLRKICDHPYLFPSCEDKSNNPAEAHKRLLQSSGKLVLLNQLLKRLKVGNHRVLIYSQMTKMLDILEDFLHGCGYGYERFDGSTSQVERQRAIDRFNRGASGETSDGPFCFLLSTRAGGVGINLATADTVILYDSDWNPHRDLQALSRCHRIGQKNKVLVLRLVTQGTVEEEILRRAKDKLVLEHLVVAKMEKVFETGEIEQILKCGAASVFEEENYGPDDEIYYDDAAIEQLLVRSDAPSKDADDKEKDGSLLSGFNVARVWQEGADENDEGFWKELLKDAIPEEKEESDQFDWNQFGERKLRDRKPKVYNYDEQDDADNDNDSEASMVESSQDTHASDESMYEDGGVLKKKPREADTENEKRKKKEPKPKKEAPPPKGARRTSNGGKKALAPPVSVGLSQSDKMLMSRMSLPKRPRAIMPLEPLVQAGSALSSRCFRCAREPWLCHCTSLNRELPQHDAQPEPVECEPCNKKVLCPVCSNHPCICAPTSTNVHVKEIDKIVETQLSSSSFANGFPVYMPPAMFTAPRQGMVAHDPFGDGICLLRNPFPEYMPIPSPVYHNYSSPYHQGPDLPPMLPPTEQMVSEHALAAAQAPAVPNSKPKREVLCVECICAPCVCHSVAQVLR